MFAGKPEHSCILAPVASDSHEPRAELSVKTLFTQKKTQTRKQTGTENKRRRRKPKPKPKTENETKTETVISAQRQRHHRYITEGGTSPQFLPPLPLPLQLQLQLQHHHQLLLLLLLPTFPAHFWLINARSSEQRREVKRKAQLGSLVNYNT